MKNNHQYELSKVKTSMDEAEIRFSDRLTFELHEQEGRNRDNLQQKDFQINSLQHQIGELELRIQSEQHELMLIQKQQNNLENDYKSTYTDFSKQLKDKDGKFTICLITNRENRETTERK